MKRIVSLLAMFLFLGTISLAQWVQTTLPGFNGTSHALLVSGTNLFAGTDSGGVFLSTNNGTSWTAVNTGIGLTDRYVWAMIATSYNVLVGTSGATYVSTNNGANWTSTSGSGGVSAFAMSVSNLVSTNVFAGTGGGVFLSTNNGVVWKLVKTGLTTTDVRALAVSDTNIFAGTFGGGVFLSTNNGSKWTAVGTSQMDGSVRALLFSGRNLFAGTGNGVYVSSDKGSNWTSVSAGLETVGYVDALEAYTTNLYAGTWSGEVFLSTNNGQNWTSISTNLVANGPVHAFAISNGFLFAGTNNGVWRLPLSVNTIDPGWVHSPETFSLTQNFPNPFNPSTQIVFSVTKEGPVTLRVFDILGREVATLVNGNRKAGEYSERFVGSRLASGVYMYVLQSAEGRLTSRMILSK